MRIFISTGEVSGDLQGGMLVEALYHQAEKLAIDLEIVALGGDRMAAAGAKLIANTTAIGSVGLFESIPFIFPTWQIQRQAKKYLQENSVELIILIDYLGPNLAIGSYIKDKLPSIPIIWYIAPQYWVWSPLKRDVDALVKIPDRILAIFPEEAKFFQSKGLATTYVGHPLLDRMATAPTREEARAKLGIHSDQKVITLLPASRKQEIKYLLPLMCQAAQQIQIEISNVHFCIPISLPHYRQAIATMVNKYNL
jgi:lipid-A-disaccharide synthase